MPQTSTQAVIFPFYTFVNNNKNTLLKICILQAKLIYGGRSQNNAMGWMGINGEGVEENFLARSECLPLDLLMVMEVLYVYKNSSNFKHLCILLYVKYNFI